MIFFWSWNAKDVFWSWNTKGFLVVECKGDFVGRGIQRGILLVVKYKGIPWPWNTKGDFLVVKGTRIFQVVKYKGDLFGREIQMLFWS